MISRVLLPVNDSETAERAARRALEAYSEAEITALHVVGEPSPTMGKAVSLASEDDIEQAAEEHASAVLQRARDIADRFDAESTTDAAWRTPAEAIITGLTFRYGNYRQSRGTSAERLPSGTQLGRCSGAHQRR